MMFLRNAALRSSRAAPSLARSFTLKSSAPVAKPAKSALGGELWRVGSGLVMWAGLLTIVIGWPGYFVIRQKMYQNKVYNQ